MSEEGKVIKMRLSVPCKKSEFYSDDVKSLEGFNGRLALD
jgi:hypothetical protein